MMRSRRLATVMALVLVPAVLAAFVVLGCERRDVAATSPTPAPSAPAVPERDGNTEPGTSANPDSPATLYEEDVRGALDRLELAWQSDDLDTVRSIYAPDATIVIHTGKDEHKLGLEEYLRLSSGSRKALSDYRYRLVDSRVDPPAAQVKAYVNVVEDAREGDRPVHSEADVTYVFERRNGEARIVSATAKVVTAERGSAEGWGTTLPPEPTDPGAPGV